MGLVWGFHLQYAQPAPFYLKVPTMLYVFIFIALRALRFESLYVAAAGLEPVRLTYKLSVSARRAEPPARIRAPERTRCRREVC